MKTSAPLRQAAILLSALPKSELAAVLKRLEPSHAAMLTRQLTTLSTIPAAELHVALGRFFSALQATTSRIHPVQSPMHPAAELDAPTASAPEKVTETATVTRDAQVNGAEILRTDVAHSTPPTVHERLASAEAIGLPVLEELPVDKCVDVLDDEDVQFVAAVMFALSPKKAAAIVERIAFNRRVRVLQILTSIEELPAKTLAHVRERIERKLEFGNDLHTRPEGLHRARHLLEQLSPGVQRGIADALAVQSPALASELHRNIFRFNDLTRLHRHDVEKIVRLIAGERLAVALKYAENRVREYALAALPAASAKAVRESMGRLDDLTLQQSTDAQQQIVDVINELFRKRVIARPRTATATRAA